MKKRRLFVLRRKSGGAGGAQKVAADYAHRFGGNWEAELVHAGSTVDGFWIGGASGPGWLRSLAFTRDADRLVANVRPDAVLSLERGPGCDVYRAGDGVHRRWMRIKYGRSARWMLNPVNWVNLYLERRCVTRAGHIVANSEMVAGDLRAEYSGIVDSKVRVIRNGFDPDRFNLDGSGHLPQECAEDAQAGRCVLFLGSGFERKGLDWVIRFFAELCSRDPDWRQCGKLWIAGRGNEAPYRRIASELGISGQTRFLGAIDEPAELCRQAQLMVLPTRYDPFANATLEALACGCPVVTTAANGASEIIQPGNTGWVLDKLRHDVIAAAGREFLEGSSVDRAAVAASVAGMTRKQEMDAFSELLS